MLIGFLALTFGISLLSFACVVAIPAARTPESAAGLPFWLVMVWGPSLAAILISAQNGQLPALLLHSIEFSTVPPVVWILVLAPLLMLLMLRPFAPEQRRPVGPGVIAAMVGLNLILGPLGEELGWRGIMQADLNPRIGWLSASLLIGVVWLIWHLPLWTIDTPHSQITLPLFAAHCLLYAVIIGAAYTLSGGSILPAILIHLTVNLASNFATFAGFRDPNAWFKASLWPYLALAAGAVALVYAHLGQFGLWPQP
ncbi:Abortive infection protein [Ruegeria sp. TM1040]|uniref:CPBP family intramembrane glutamic endopeptidase n=1 Tax=Ruegeria sp. (strain TM1040) TaxID=292414 RepID=UPI0000462FB9|nr:CPBP family intramembrane glutamic endopeptidase [Ruegeria sp. TM1040]ABF64881.1 Abortive infection protein [Ruegeria sp. TM1040]